MSPLPPRGRLQVLPDDWSAHHRPAAEGFLTGTCRCNGPEEEAPWTPDNPGGLTPGPVIWPDMPCSVQVLSQFGREATVVGTTEVVVSHRVSVPIELEAEYGDVITVLTNPDDERLNGTRLRVISVDSGTTNWTRELACEELNRGH